MTRFLLAGGGTAGHVNPMLALADAIKADSGKHEIFALGTVEGLEARLVPQRGYQLLTIDKVPFPRKLNKQALSFFSRFNRAVKQVEHYVVEKQIEVVVGFGGYASAPAYRAAKKLGLPLVIHEANALPGLANRWGARSANAVATAFRNTKLPNATFVGMPLRKELENLANHVKNQADISAARAHFGLDDSNTTLLVTGGSLGARSINSTIAESTLRFKAAGIQLLHITGDKSDLQEIHTSDLVRIKYCDRMDLAITAADFAVARAGAATVSEFAAVGLPAVYVPYPVGNGEQRFNVQDLLDAKGGLLCLDADFTPEYVSAQLIPAISNSRERRKIAVAAKSIGVANGSQRLLTLIKGVLG